MVNSVRGSAKFAANVVCVAVPTRRWHARVVNKKAGFKLIKEIHYTIKSGCMCAMQMPLFSCSDHYVNNVNGEPAIQF